MQERKRHERLIKRLLNSRLVAIIQQWQFFLYGRRMAKRDSAALVADWVYSAARYLTMLTAPAAFLTLMSY